MGNIRTSEIREINSKLFAIDIEYNDNIDIEVIIGYIIQKYDPSKVMAGVPYILRVKTYDIDENLLDNLRLIGKKSAILQINSNAFEDHYHLELVRKIHRELEIKIIVEINSNDLIFTHTNNLADYIKLDIHNLPNMGKLDIASDIYRIAYNVDTPEDYKLAETIRADYNEGSYISDDLSFNTETVKYSKLNFIEILKLLNIGSEYEKVKDKLSKDEEDKLVKLISHDPLLTAQLIRLSNSVYFSSDDYDDMNIGSIRDAIARISFAKLKNWLIMLSFNTDDTVKEEAIQLAYHRAIFCKKIIQFMIFKNPAVAKQLSERKAYMVGLLSTLDLLTGEPIDKQIAGLNLSSKIYNALIFREGLGGTLLNFIKAYDNCDEEHIGKYLKELNIGLEDVANVYYGSIKEAAEVWRELENDRKAYTKSLNV